MFVFSFRHNRRKTVAVLAVLLVAVTAAIVVTCLRSAEPEAVSSDRKYSLSASTNEQRVAFFKQFGWTVNPEPIDEGEVTIPEKFGDVYITYNNIQKEQGLDLLPYAGKTVQQWIYAITNFPQQETMRGTLLVYNGKVIGGDLSTPQLDGFMTGFDGKVDKDISHCIGEIKPGRDSTGALTTTSSAAAVSTASIVEASRPASSTIPANAWPTD
jgi:hypothetical protein